MAKKPNITIEQLRRLVSYNAVTGEFTWLPRTSEFYSGGRACPQKLANNFNTRFAGKRADRPGAGCASRYRKIKITTKNGCVGCYAHHAAIAFTTGAYPSGLVDHINLDTGDNRICNLRIADPSQNNMNAPARSRNRLGVKGVTETKWGFLPQIRAYGVKHYLGYFKTIEEAKAAYDAAAERLHGKFARKS